MFHSYGKMWLSFDLHFHCRRCFVLLLRTFLCRILPIFLCRFLRIRHLRQRPVPNELLHESLQFVSICQCRQMAQDGKIRKLRHMATAQTRAVGRKLAQNRRALLPQLQLRHFEKRMRHQQALVEKYCDGVLHIEHNLLVQKCTIGQPMSAKKELNCVLIFKDHFVLLCYHTHTAQYRFRNAQHLDIVYKTLCMEQRADGSGVIWISLQRRKVMFRLEVLNLERFESLLQKCMCYHRQMDGGSQIVEATMMSALTLASSFFTSDDCFNGAWPFLAGSAQLQELYTLARQNGLRVQRNSDSKLTIRRRQSRGRHCPALLTIEDNPGAVTLRAEPAAGPIFSLSGGGQQRWIKTDWPLFRWAIRAVFEHFGKSGKERIN